MRREVSRGARRGPGAVACLLQQLSAVGAEYSGDCPRGAWPGVGEPGPLSPLLGSGQTEVVGSPLWAPGRSALWTLGPGVDVGPWGGQPCGCRAPGRSALRMLPAAAEGSGCLCESGGGDMTPPLSPPRELSPESLLAEDLEKDPAPL